MALLFQLEVGVNVFHCEECNQDFPEQLSLFDFYMPQCCPFCSTLIEEGVLNMKTDLMYQYPNFITFEGPEGSGKTTIIKMIYDYLCERGKHVMLTREPGGIEIAEQIRSVILDTRNTKMDSRTEALLYAAARRQHLTEKVLPALEEGHIVLCDRFVDSSLAYQGYARGLGIEEVWEMNRFAIKDCMPKFTIYFDVPPEVGLARIKANEEREVNRLDLEKIQFHQDVVEGYKQVIEQNPGRFFLVDATQSVEQVFGNVKAFIDKLY